MRARRPLAAMLAVAAIAGCGDDEGGDGGGGSDKPAKPAAVRCTPAPGGGKKLVVEPRFMAGDRRTISIEKTREDPSKPGPLSATADADLRVVSGGPKKATLRWTTGDFNLPLPENADPEVLERIKEVSEDIPVEYETDADGSPAGLTNLPELRTAVGRMLDEMEELDPKLKQVSTVMRPIMQSEQSLQATMTQELALLHEPYGLELKEGDSYETSYELPNPLNGEPIPADVTYTLADTRDPSGCAVIETVILPDVEVLKQTLIELGERAGAPPPDEGELDGYKMRNTARFTYDPGTGWVVKAEGTKNIALGERRRTDRTVLTSAPAG